ncbi:MAG: YbaN family protein [Abyssibacter sp.]|uniref:YbaN family protein n=1 Tax=Abyssibacter sp. TaxID=2320200 RepID=UPI003219BBB9
MNKPAMPRLLWWLFAYACLVLGLIGIVVPGLPTTVFILLAAWAATRGSPRLQAWLEHHPRFGPAIRNWREHGTVPRSAKRLATLMMVLSWALTTVVTRDWLIAVVVLMLLTGVGLWLWHRPEPS